MEKIIDYIPFSEFTILDDATTVNESSKSEVAASDGHILAIVKGKHFCPGSVSRNNRYYPNELWEMVGNDPEVKRKLETNQMFGRIGHECEITDEDLADGRVSHYTRNIDWKTGIAESVILNTPMGRALYTYLRAKCILYVSSRADGSYCGTTDNAENIMDKDTYKLERFDFVQDPGFLDAKPTIVSESYNPPNTPIDNDMTSRVLIEIAYKMGCPLILDDREYTIVSFDATSVSLEDIDGNVDSYSYSDFNDVTNDIITCITTTYNSAVGDLDSANERIRMLEFANEQGLDSDYVENRVKSGKTYEAIVKDNPRRPTSFKVVGAVKDTNSFKDIYNEDNDPTYLKSVFK